MSKGNRLFGIFMIIAGGFLLLERFQFIDGDVFLLFLGLAFIIAYFSTDRPVGLLIPGSILSWFGLYVLLMEQSPWPILDEYSGGLFFVALAMAFITIFVHTYLRYRGGSRFWPLYPAFGLIMVAFIVEFDFSLIPGEYMHYLETYWPVLLVFSGVIMFLTSLRKKGD